VSTVSVHGRHAKTDEMWARLIPGEYPGFQGKRKKPPQSVRHGLHEIPVRHDGWNRDSTLSVLLPRPFQSRMAKRCLHSLTVDCALIVLDWLLVGALLVPMRGLFPHRRVFEFAHGTPLSLLGIAVLHAALITLIGYTEGLYSSDCDPGERRKIVAKSVALGTIVLGCGHQLQGATWSIATLFGLAGTLHFGALAFWRQGHHQTAARQTATERAVLIIGGGTVGRRVAAYLEQHPAEGRSLCGILDDERPLGDGIVGRVGELAQIARRGFVEEIILAGPQDRELTRWVFQEARRLRLDLEVVPELFGCDPAMSEVEHLDGLPVICLHAERLPAASLVLKRVADFVGAGIACLLISPLLAVIALAIKLDSEGPVLYSAHRAGRKGRIFRCHKFRTMVTNADQLKRSLRQNNERSGPFFKITGDPRITRVGHILRRYSLDELPQLLNVLKGEMSLVGPRPHPLDDVAGYELEHLARLDVTPGLTGLWQVTARRDPSFQRGMELDREYIRTWSLALDLRILLKTVTAVLQGSGE